MSNPPNANEPHATQPITARASWPYWAAGVGALLVQVVVLHLMGRIPWPRAGFELWTSEALGKSTSQLLTDPYSLTHVVHGALFYAVIHWLAGAKSLQARFLMAMIAEVAWEILENSPPVIERYRNATAALGYVGDSILNSVGDVGCCMFGFLLASRLPTRVTILLVLVEELVLLFTIRDNLALNVIMLLFPLESLKQWQAAG